MNLLIQLRRLCDHPYLLPDCEPDPYYIGEHVVASSSKVIAVDKILEDILPKGEKVLIFSVSSEKKHQLERNLKDTCSNGLGC
jgi:SWI/SNF-related matrix-associated actin-dependent regulator of chromatin subfamily A member 5